MLLILNPSPVRVSKKQGSLVCPYGIIGIETSDIESRWYRWQKPPESLDYDGGFLFLEKTCSGGNFFPGIFGFLTSLSDGCIIKSMERPKLDEWMQRSQEVLDEQEALQEAHRKEVEQKLGKLTVPDVEGKDI